MAMIRHPHPDLELGFPRTPVDYVVTAPAAGVGAATGLIVYACGWGFGHDDDYARKLAPHLADTYDCLVLRVNYHGAEAQFRPRLTPSPTFFAELKRHHGVEVSAPAGMDPMDIAKGVLEQMAALGVQEMHSDCVLLKDEHGYINFGVLPALDILQAVAEVLRDYEVNRRRIFAFGTSYGGYLALMLAKFAPETFRLVIDNSGFSGPSDSVATIMGVTKYLRPRTPIYCPFSFSKDPASPRWFSPARQLIRDIGIAAHWQAPSSTIIHIYHAAQDSVAPTARKTQIAAILGQFRDLDLRIITEADVDGRLFKTASHSMGASLRDLFDLSYRRWLSQAATPADTTDFDQATVNRLPCGELDYVITFSRDGVRLTIESST